MLLPSVPSVIMIVLKMNLQCFFFRQHYPYLQRLYLQGNVIVQDLQIMDNIPSFHFPSLLHVHIGQIHYILAIQIFDQCPQLRSFSAQLYEVDPENENITRSTISLPARISAGLTAMKKLNLSETYGFRKKVGPIFYELLLPCCPNLRTFVCKFQIWYSERKIDADWWEHLFASNAKLKRISLDLMWYIRDWPTKFKEKIHCLQQSPFFTQLNANLEYKLGDYEPMVRMGYSLQIKN